MPNFDSSKASEWYGAVFDKATNTISNFKSDKITYTYNIGQNKSETFTLSLTDPDPLTIFIFDPDKTAETAIITGYTRLFQGGNVTLPSTVTIDDIKCTVTGIGKDAFYNCETLESVTIPNTITEIGSKAFDVTKVTRHYEWRKVK